MSADREARIQRLLDREEIEDCLFRYARGVDRLDADLIRSAFHPDALDCRGDSPQSPEEFLAGWLPSQPLRDLTEHLVTNVMIDVEGDVAHVESRFFAAIKLAAEPDVSLHGSRCVDRFERREGKWRIAVRVTIPEWHVKVPMQTGPTLSTRGWGSRSKDDPSYLRPLTGWPL